MVMGVSTQPHIESYYTKNSKLYGNKLVQQILPNKNRYFEIKKYIKINATALEQYITHRFKMLYIPGANISIDETMIAFKGRFRFRQYIRGKPHSTGLKCYSIACSNGYLLAFFLYNGRHEFESYTTKSFATKGSRSPDIIHTVDEAIDIMHTELEEDNDTIDSMHTELEEDSDSSGEDGTISCTGSEAEEAVLN